MMPKISMVALFCQMCVLLYATVLCATLLTRSISAAKWWKLATLSDSSSPVEHQSFVLYLKPRQRSLLNNHGGSITAVIRGLHLAIEECQHQFHGQFWNCTVDLSKTSNTLLFGSIVSKGCRETAFIYAIISASVAREITTACAEGRIGSCACDSRYHGKGGADWNWGGCSHNAIFGYEFAQKFIDRAERAHDIRYVMNVHNSEAGRLHVQKTLKKCTCHGASGTCTIQTCWQSVQDLRSIGNKLMRRFNSATKIKLLNRQHIAGAGRGGGTGEKLRRKRFDLHPAQPNSMPPKRKDLVYIEDSPDFCADEAFYSSAISKRQCNASSPYANGCQVLCCNGYFSKYVEIVDNKCHCQFKWCCEVECKTCRRMQLQHFCN